MTLSVHQVQFGPATPWSKLLYSELRAVCSFGKRFSRAVDTVDEPDVPACAGGALSARVCTRTRFSSRHRDCNKMPCLTNCATSVAAQEQEKLHSVHKVHLTADAGRARSHDVHGVQSHLRNKRCSVDVEAARPLCHLTIFRHAS